MVYSEINKKIFYGSNDQQFVRCTRPASNTVLPVLVVIHGGYWKQSHTLDSYATKEIAEYFKNKPVVVWDIEYRRLAFAQSQGDINGLDMVSDVAQAMALIRNVAEQYGLDLNNIVLMGHSAGGHLAACAGSQGEQDQHWPFFRANSLVPQKMILVSAVLNLEMAMMGSGLQGIGQVSQPEQVEHLLSVEQRLSQSLLSVICPSQRQPTANEIILIHGDHDEAVPHSQTLDYQQRWSHLNLKKIIYPGCGHFGMFQMKGTTQENYGKAIYWNEFIAEIERAISNAPSAITVKNLG
ncbi:alpha/beta hydrolase [Reinekea sp.]|jgi:acetyl esterase/lipase|uniref:alpha/beta hydrolase n=1 Tax=Reinekea sp. TaxID=1970455 RepID=UPI003988CF13